MWLAEPALGEPSEASALGRIHPRHPPAIRATGVESTKPAEDMTVFALPGHAGRVWPLIRWRSLARTGAWVPR